MNKLILSLLLCPCFTLLLAQEAPGLRNVIGGQFNMRYINGATGLYDQLNLNGSDDSKYRELNLYPYAAWKVADHWLLGFRLGYGSSYEKRQYFFGTGIRYYQNLYTQTKGLRLIGRYYLRPSAKFGLYIEPTLGYLGTKSKQREGGSFIFSNRITNHEFNFMAAPGLVYHASERLGLLLRMGQVGYGFGKRDYEDGSTVSKDKYSNFFFDFNLSFLYFGAEYRWGGQKTPN